MDEDSQDGIGQNGGVVSMLFNAAFVVEFTLSLLAPSLRGSMSMVGHSEDALTRIRNIEMIELGRLVGVVLSSFSDVKLSPFVK